MRKLLPIMLIVAVLAGGAYVGLKRRGVEKPIPRGKALVASFLNADQGGAVVFETPEGSFVVFDPGFEENVDALADYLKTVGARSVTLVVTFPSREYAAAARKLIGSFPVDRVIHGEMPSVSREWDKTLEAIEQARIPELILAGGDLLHLSKKVKLEVLSPPRGLLEGAEEASGNNSLVTRVSFGRTRFLLTSQARIEVEGHLIQSVRDLESSVLVVPRHGQAGSTSLELISLVRPECFVVMDGGRGGRPSASVLARISTRNTGAQVLRTDKDGSFDIVSDGRSIEVVKEVRKP
jgi:competence protein ComEC